MNLSSNNTIFISFFQVIYIILFYYEWLESSKRSRREGSVISMKPGLQNPLWEEVDMGDQRIVDLAPAKAPWSTHNQHHPDAVIGQVALFVPML
jgi:hypothetical protein